MGKRTKELEEKLKAEYKKLKNSKDGVPIEEMEMAVSDYYKSSGKVFEDIYEFLEENVYL